MTKLRTYIDVLRRAIHEFNQDGGMRMAAALAYFALFSLTPLLVLAAVAVQYFFGPEQAGVVMTRSLGGVIGGTGAQALEGLLVQATPQEQREFSIITAVLSIGAVIFGTTRLFSQMKAVLNYIWDVAPHKSSVRGIVWSQFLLFLAALGIGAILILSLIANAGFAAIRTYADTFLPAWLHLGQILNLLISFGLITLLVAAMYRVLPDVQIQWRDVWAGAMFTAALFVPGQFLIGLYLARSGIASTYGAASSIIVVLIWVYFSAQIFVLGAEFTQVFAKQHGRAILPGERAVQMMRRSVIEHQQEIDKIEDEFEQHLAVIKQEAEALKAGIPNPNHRKLERTGLVIAPLISLITGIGIGVFGMRRREDIWTKVRKRFL